jgi:hypothetical protein
LRGSSRGTDSLGREDIAKEDLFYIFGLDLGNALNGTCAVLETRSRVGWNARLLAEAAAAGERGSVIAPLMAWEPSWIAVRLERELQAGNEKKG